jgi:hypothetical protein
MPLLFQGMRMLDKNLKRENSDNRHYGSGHAAHAWLG